MIKSLPIENILPKESLSSKKSVKKENSKNSSFRKVLDKTFDGANAAKSSKTADNIKQNFKDGKHKIEHKKSDNLKNTSASNSHVFVVPQKTDAANIGVKFVEKLKKKSLRIEGRNAKKSATIASEKKAGKIVVFKKIELKSVKNRTISIKKSPKKTTALKNSTKDEAKLIKTKQAFVKSSVGKYGKNQKTEGQQKAILSNTKNIDSLKNVDKTESKKSADKSEALSFVKAKTDKNPKMVINSDSVSDKKNIFEKNNIEVVKKHNVHKTEAAVVRDSKNVKNLKQHNVPETNKKGSATDSQKSVPAEISVNIVPKNYVNAKKNSVDINIRNNSAESTKNKYVKRLNIKEIKVVKESEEHTKKDTLAKLNPNKPIDTKGNNSQTARLLKNTAANFNNELQTVVETVQKQNKTVKIETLKNVKNNKVVKVVSFDVEDLKDKKSDKSIKGQYVKAAEKHKAIKFNVRMNNKTMLKNPENVKTGSDLFVSKIISKGAGELNTKKDKDIVENALNISAHNLNSTHTADMNIKGIATHYPLDKVIENIDKMMNMKPPFNNTVTIKLEPPHIGVLELRIKMDKDKNISAFITAQDKDVVRLINAHTDGLKTYLNSQGIKVTHIDVHNGFNEQAGFGGGHNQGMANGNQQNATREQNFGFNSFGNNRASGEFSDTTKRDIYKNNLKLTNVDITV